MEAAMPVTAKQGGMPVTIITGFLGAGKSTLLNRILRNAQGVRVAVFINELGALDIDGSLVAMRQQVDDTDLVLLNNGCVCCSISANLVRSVNDVLLRAQVCCIVIETTGAADLLPLINTFQVSEDFEGRVHIDSVITVVDALSFGHADFLNSSAARNQLLYADVLLLNKVDQVGSQDKLDAIEMQLRRLSVSSPNHAAADHSLCKEAKNVRIIRCSHAKVDLALILDTTLITAPAVIDGGSGVTETPSKPAGNAVARTELRPPLAPSWANSRCSSSLAGQHFGPTEDGGFSSVAFECAERPFDPLRFVSFLTAYALPMIYSCQMHYS